MNAITVYHAVTAADAIEWIRAQPGEAPVVLDPRRRINGPHAGPCFIITGQPWDVDAVVFAATSGHAEHFVTRFFETWKDQPLAFVEIAHARKVE